MEYIFLIVILLCVSGLMIGLGIWQVKSDKPVTFYTGSEPPKASELTDIKAWNVKHGSMWIIYGIIIIIGGAICLLMIESIWCIIPLFIAFIVPIPFMIFYHNKLKKMYYRK